MGAVEVHRVIDLNNQRMKRNTLWNAIREFMRSNMSPDFIVSQLEEVAKTDQRIADLSETKTTL